MALILIFKQWQRQKLWCKETMKTQWPLQVTRTTCSKLELNTNLKTKANYWNCSKCRCPWQLYSKIQQQQQQMRWDWFKCTKEKWPLIRLRLLKMLKYYKENYFVGCHFASGESDLLWHIDFKLVVGTNALCSGHISRKGLEVCRK